jgi:hypothetical protein
MLSSGMTESVQAKAVRRQGLRAIGAALPQVTKSALAKRGFAAARVIADWPEIVGPVLAAASIPERLLRDRAGGEPVLQVKVSPGAALELQHLEPLVIERINSHFGFVAVARLKLRQGHVQRPMTMAPRPKALDAATEHALAERVQGVGDGDLQSALLALGRAVERRR